MKKFILIVAFAVAQNGSATDSYEGVFSASKSIGILAYRTAKACKDAEGYWKDGVCLFEAEDTVEVRANSDHYLVKITTVTTNAHFCDFEGKGQRYVDAIKASVETDEGACEVTVEYTNSAVVSVSNNGKCSKLCGANAVLEIKRAVRD